MSTASSASPQAAHSLFPEEWQARYADELERLMQDWTESELDSEQIEARCAAFYTAHPPRFEGVYCTESVAAAGDLTELPPLVQTDELWIDGWREQPPRRVRAVIPIAYHRLVALVTDTELIILRADELARVTSAQVPAARGG